MTWAYFVPGQSDVHVYLDVCTDYTCAMCRLSPGFGENFLTAQYTTISPAEMIAHLREHLARGDLVPPNVIPALELETKP